MPTEPAVLDAGPLPAKPAATGVSRTPVADEAGTPTAPTATPVAAAKATADAASAAAPAQIAEGKPLVAVPKPPLPQSGKADTTAVSAADRPAPASNGGNVVTPRAPVVAVAQTDARTTTQAGTDANTQAEVETELVELAAKSAKPAAERESLKSPPAPTTSAAAKAKPSADTPALAAQSTFGDMLGSDIRVNQPLHFAAMAIQSTNAAHGGSPAAPASMPAAATMPVPMAGLAVTIAANAQLGNNRFEIRLDPPELGRIDVRLQFDSGGQVTSHLIVDRAETLDLLRRDAADLERSLQQAGLKTSDNGLQFSLRDRSNDNGGADRHQGPTAQVVVADDDAVTNVTMRGFTRAGQGAGIDIHV